MGRRLSKKRRNEPPGGYGMGKRIRKNNLVKFQHDITLGGQAEERRRTSCRLAMECNICLELVVAKGQRCCGYLVCRKCLQKYHDYQIVRGVKYKHHDIHIYYLYLFALYYYLQCIRVLSCNIW